MNNPLLAAAVAVALSLGSAAQAAAPDDDFAQIRSQLQSLIQRVDKLEAENASLKVENGQLKSQTDQLARQSAEFNKQLASAGPDAPKAAAKASDWPNRIAIKGDIRYRHQETDDERTLANRDEELLRARLSVEGKVNDNVVAAVGVATSSAPGNPRGANVQLDGEFSRKSLYLDLAYFDWTFIDNAHVIGGKMKIPFARPGQSLFWDNDINPEGLAVTYSAGSLFGSAWSYLIEENVPSTAATAAAADTTDTKMFGLQVGNRFELGMGNLTVAASYYDLAAAKGRRPFFNGSSNGNSLNGAGGLAFDFQVIGLMAEFNTKLGALPLQVWADVAQNRDAELDTAQALGVVLGKAGAAGSWESGLAYQKIEKDALFAQHIDSDFLGLSDADGWIMRTGFAPMKNWVLNATYFKTAGNRDVGTEFDFDRLLLDFNAKF